MFFLWVFFSFLSILFHFFLPSPTAGRDGAIGDTLIRDSPLCLLLFSSFPSSLFPLPSHFLTFLASLISTLFPLPNLSPLLLSSSPLSFFHFPPIYTYPHPHSSQWVASPTDLLSSSPPSPSERVTPIRLRMSNLNSTWRTRFMSC